MNTEQKAQAYDEALDRARKVHKYSSDLAEIKRMEDIFPELKGSEDERAKKEITNIIMQSTCNTEKEFHRKRELIDWLEKQGKVPPADKSESKFHEGDWVVFNNRHDSVYQVEKIENYEYTLRHFLGGSMPLSFSHEDMIRAWNVKDARDGDVLASQYNKPFIYNGNYDSILIGSYCGISAGDSFTVATEKCHWTENVSIYPATKEQRDLLFQKMHEDGYTFDFKKKELKKLKFRVGDEVITENEESLTITRIDEKGYWSNDLFICGFDDSAEWELVEQKPEWSEEDENILQRIWDEILANKHNAEEYEWKTYDKFLAWLKSLKARYTWKPSEEQLKCLQHYADQNNYDGAILTSLYNDLKQLKKSFT